MAVRLGLTCDHCKMCSTPPLDLCSGNASSITLLLQLETNYTGFQSHSESNLKSAYLSANVCGTRHQHILLKCACLFRLKLIEVIFVRQRMVILLNQVST